MHCALSDDCRATAHCNSSLGVSTSTHRISTSLVPEHTHHTRTRQVWRLHLALQRRPSRRPSSAGTFCAAEATSTRRTSAQQPPCGRPSPGSQPPAAAAGFSSVADALAACQSTAAARPVVHQPLLEQQVTLRRLSAGAVRRSAAAACTEWCLRTTRPAAPEGRASSSPGRAPKERPPDRAGRRREACERMRSVPKACKFPKKRYLIGLGLGYKKDSTSNCTQIRCASAR